MRALPTAAAGLLALAVAAPAWPQSTPRLTVERVASLPSVTGTAPGNVTFSPDGRLVAFLWNDAGMPFRDVWIADATGGDPRRLTRLDTAASDTTDDPSFESLRRRATARLRGGVSDVTWMPDGKALVFVHEGRLHQVNADGSGVRPLWSEAAGASRLAFAPDGKRLAFLSGGDLWFWHPDTGPSARATRVGQAPVGQVAGARYLRNDVGFSSFEWSPDSRRVALHFDDLREVREVLIPDYLGEETRTNALRRDFPGENDHVREVVVYDVTRGGQWTLPLPDRTDRRIATYAWSPDGTSLLVDQSSEDAVDRWITVADPVAQTVRTAWHDRRDSRTTVYWNSTWRSDGQAILFISDKDDRHHLYSVPAGGGAATRLTQGDFSIVGAALGTSPLFVSLKTREIFFLSTRKNPYERQVYRMPETGGEITQVTTLAGVHAPTFSADGSRLALVHSSDTTAPALFTVERTGGAERRVTSPPKEFASYPWVTPKYVTFKSHVDGAILHGRLVEPPNLDRTKKYPVIIGPVYADTVRNQWRGTFSTLQQFLAIEKGYIGLHVDIRGSVGYGRDHKERLLRDYAGIDVEDLASGAAYLKTLPYVDPSRIAIWGSSYGGLMTLHSLFRKPGLYRAGVAGAPASNVWHATTGEVDVAKRPDVNPDVYRKASAFSFGEQLADPLMIIHGMQDDVVLFKDSVMLAEKLMLLGKDFEFVVAPSAVHGWSQKDYYGVYLLRKMVAFFDRHLAPATAGTR